TCLAACILAQLRQRFVALVLYRSRFDTRYCSEETGFSRDAENGRFGTLRNIDSILKIGPAKRIIAVRNYDDHPSAWNASQLFICELPYGIVKRGLRAGFFDLIDGLLQKVVFVGKILSKIYLIVESHEGPSIFSYLNYGVQEIGGGFL